MSAGVDDLYRDVILDHNRQPRNYGMLEGGRKGEGHIPLCGDHLTVYVGVDEEVIMDVRFQGTGCAISKASASLMTESVKGRTVGEAISLSNQIERMLVAPPGAPLDDLGQLKALAGVRQFPLRVKCAMLAWRALRTALD